MIELIMQPWPWYVVGPLIVISMFFLLYFGREFGVSASLRACCSAAGGGKFADFFRFDWKSQAWNFMFILGGIIGGFISVQFLEADQTVELADATVERLEAMGVSGVGESFLPAELFSPDQITLTHILFLLIGGGLVGFGARYAGGCTSGHAISGLSNLQLPSLIAVIGFFIGGLAMAYFILPAIYPF